MLKKIGRYIGFTILVFLFAISFTIFFLSILQKEIVVLILSGLLVALLVVVINDYPLFRTDIKSRILSTSKKVPSKYRSKFKHLRNLIKEESRNLNIKIDFLYAKNYNNGSVFYSHSSDSYTIVIGDIYYLDYSIKELESVVYHEIGHIINGDLDSINQNISLLSGMYSRWRELKADLYSREKDKEGVISYFSLLSNIKSTELRSTEMTINGLFDTHPKSYLRLNTMKDPSLVNQIRCLINY